MKELAVNVVVATVVVLAGLLTYDRLVAQPAMRVGVVDLASVYRAKEAEFAQAIARNASPADREQAMAAAQSFAERLPTALEELPRECACLVMLKASVAGRPPNSIDLTGALAQKVGVR